MFSYLAGVAAPAATPTPAAAPLLHPGDGEPRAAAQPLQVAQPVPGPGLDTASATLCDCFIICDNGGLAEDELGLHCMLDDDLLGRDSGLEFIFCDVDACLGPDTLEEDSL